MAVLQQERIRDSADLDEATFARLLIMESESITDEKYVSVKELDSLLRIGLVDRKNVALEVDEEGHPYAVAVVDGFAYDALIDERWGYSR